jgi:hypothetical protein
LTELRRSLGLLDATIVNVGVIVGSAVFLTASDVARALPHPLYGWALLVVIQTASIAAVAVAFASYWGHFLPLSPRGAELVAVAAIAALTGVSVLGVREGVWGYPLAPAAFVAFAAILLGATVASAPGDAALGGGLLLTGVPAYLFFRNRARSAAPATHRPT